MLTKLLAPCMLMLPVILTAQQNWWNELVLFGTFPLNNQTELAPAEKGGETIEIPSDLPRVMEEANALKDAGGYYVSNISVFNPSFEAYQATPQLASARVLDVNEEPMVVPWETRPDEPAWWLNTSDEIYQDFLLKQITNLIDADIDGVLLDEIEGTAGAVNRGGGFSDEDMAGFRQYLKDNYDEAFLEENFGVTGLDGSFDYAKYLRENGYAEGYLNQEPWVFLADDFERFHRIQAQEVMSELIADARSYANFKGKSGFAISANIFGLAPHLLMFAEDLDYLTVEYPYRTDGLAPFGHAASLLKISNALGKRSLLLPSVFTGRMVHEWADTDDLFTLWIMEAFASGHNFSHAERFFAGTNFNGERQWLTPDTSHTQSIFQFVADNRFLFEGGEQIADVALVYPFTSDFVDDTREEFLGAAYALSDAKIQHDVIIFGDDRYLDQDANSAVLQRYDALVLPAARLLSDDQVARLRAYVEQGGTLVLTGQAGAATLNDKPADRPTWSSMVAEGSRQVGSGRVVSLPEDYGERYVVERSDQLRALLTTPVRDAAHPRTSGSLPDLSHVLLQQYETASGAMYVAHVLNYNYSQYIDGIWPSRPGELKLQVPESVNATNSYQVYRLSTDGTAEQVNFTTEAVSGETRVSFSVPSGGPYTAYVLIPAAHAQSLANDAEDITQEAYETALNRAQSQGRDVSTLQTLFAEETSAQEAGSHLAARSLRQQLQREIADLSRPQILFDEVLEPRNTLSAERAQEISASNPENALFSTLSDQLNDDYALLNREADAITSEYLAGVQVLVLASPTKGLSSSEIAAINSFVDGGGGLLLLGDANYGWTNGLTDPYGITINGERVSIQEGDGYAALNAPLDTSRPELASAPSEMFLSYGGTLNVSSPAETVIKTPSTAWRDANGNSQRDANEPTQAYPIGASVQVGEGRIFVLSDDPFDNKILGFTENHRLMESLLDWLATGATGAPSEGSATLTATVDQARDTVYLQYSEDLKTWTTMKTLDVDKHRVQQDNRATIRVQLDEDGFYRVYYGEPE